MQFSVTLVGKKIVLKLLEEIFSSIVVPPLTWFRCSYPGPTSNYFAVNSDKRGEVELNTE